MSLTELEKALGAVPSGLFILTIGTGTRATGMLSSWVMQAGFEPPAITVAVQQGRFVAEWLTAGEPFVINLVGEGQTSLLKHFGKGFEPMAPAFEGVPFKPCRRGIPILTEAIGHLECEPTCHVDSGDHRVFVARVVRGKLAPEAKPYVHLRKNGGRY